VPGPCYVLAGNSNLLDEEKPYEILEGVHQVAPRLALSAARLEPTALSEFRTGSAQNAFISETLE